VEKRGVQKTGRTGKKSGEMIQLKESGVVFIKDGHTYWLGDKQLFGITSVLSRQLFKNKYAGVSDDMLKRKAEYGTEIHEALQLYDDFGIIDRKEVEWYADLVDEVGFDVIENEYLVTDYDYYASGIDKVISLEGEVCLADVKTTYVLDEEYLSWQLSIYKYLFNILNPDIEIGGLYAIWIKDGAKFIKIPEIAQEEVKKLLECDKNGEQYIPPQIVPEKYEEKALDLIKKITDIAEQIETLNELKKQYQSNIEELFSRFNITKWETDYFVITKKKDSVRETFDAKRFKEEHPDMANEYIKLTPVKGGITTKLKK